MSQTTVPFVIYNGGQHGHIEADTAQLRPDSVVPIRLEDGKLAYVPQTLLQAREDGTFFLPLSQEELEQSYLQRRETGGETVVVPVVAEEINVQKRTVETGGVHIHTRVTEHVETIDVPLLRDEVTVERVAINRRVEGSAPTVRQEGDTMIVPVLEEVMVITKQLMLKEELRIRHVQASVHEPQQVTLRREEAEIERLPASAVSQIAGNRSEELGTL